MDSHATHKRNTLYNIKHKTTIHYIKRLKASLLYTMENE